MGKDSRSMSKRELIREVGRLQSLLEQQLSATPGIGDEVVVEGYATTEGKPFVQMRAGEVAWQMGPAEARLHALNVLDKASESERDAATVSFLSSEIDGMDEQGINVFLIKMREQRADWLAQIREGAG